MSNAIVAYSVTDLKDIAMAMHNSGLYKFTKPEQYLALMFKAQAENRHPATVVEDYHFFNGRAGLKAEAAMARHLESQGTVKWLQANAKVCEAEFSHPSGGTYVSKFTVEDAQRIGLMSKDVWKHYTEDMLRARVIARGCRAVNPGVFRGMRAVEELQDEPEVEAPIASAAAPVPAKPAVAKIPRASEVSPAPAAPPAAPVATDTAEDAESTPVAPAPAAEPVKAPVATPAPKATTGTKPPTDALYLKEAPGEVKHRQDPASGKLRYGTMFSVGLIGTFSEDAAKEFAQANASGAMVEIAYKVLPLVEGSDKTKKELVWFNGRAVA